MCLVVVELTDVIFALDSIPAVMSVSHETFIMVTSNIFAILGLRSLYFVLAGAMAKFKYLKYALAILLMVIGGKMLLHKVEVIHDLPNVFWLGVIAGILAVGVAASLIIASRGRTRRPCRRTWRIDMIWPHDHVVACRAGRRAVICSSASRRASLR